MRAKQPKPVPDLAGFFSVLHDESDRAAGVLAAAYLDSALERLFRARLLETAPEQIFKYRGALGDFSGKIDLAYSLGWISREVCDDLHIVRDIRNDFAHDDDHTLSFATQSVRARTKNVKCVASLGAVLTSFIAAVNAPRGEW